MSPAEAIHRVIFPHPSSSEVAVDILTIISAAEIILIGGQGTLARL
jgi:hypothetical protein